MLAPIRKITAQTTQSNSRELDITESLHRSQLFSCLSELQVQVLAKQSTVKRFSNKAVLPMLDDSMVHYLLAGRAKVCCRSAREKQPILYFANPDELVGEQAILRHSMSDHLSVEAIETCVVASIPIAPLRMLAQSEARFAFSLMDLIARRRTIVERRIQHTMFLSNRERLIHVLVDLAEQYGTRDEAAMPGSNDLRLGIKLSHQDLANLIGSTRETVTVVLGKLQQEGLLQIRRRQILIQKLDSLAKEIGRSMEASPVTF